MKIGTKSLLFGVHQFVWHPISIGLAWHECYNRWPRWWEWVAIICHDLGYWGKPNMDGVEGQTHPERGAEIAGKIAYRIAKLLGYGEWASQLAHEVHELSLYHSTHYAQKVGKPVSKLYLPDKVCILFEPRWWYLLRSKLSGEVYEYVRNAPTKPSTKGYNLYMTPVQWFGWYQEKIRVKLTEFLNSDEGRAIHNKVFKHYYIKHVPTGLYAGSCHTVGDFMWVEKPDADTFSEGPHVTEEFNILLRCGYNKQDICLELRQ